MSSSKPSKPKLIPPTNLGRIVIRYDDLGALRFWVRTFQLEPYVGQAQARMNQDIKAAYASVPVISEYVAGDLTWTYTLVLFVDRLGVSGGTGIVYFADATNLDKAREKRDEFADRIMKEFNARAAADKMEVEGMIIKPGKEQ